MKLSNHPAKFGRHRGFDTKDIEILVCHVILQDHVMKGSYGDMFLVFRVISQDYVIKGLHNFIGRDPSR